MDDWTHCFKRNLRSLVRISVGENQFEVEYRGDREDNSQSSTPRGSSFSRYGQSDLRDRRRLASDQVPTQGLNSAPFEFTSFSGKLRLFLLLMFNDYSF